MQPDPTPPDHSPATQVHFGPVAFAGATGTFTLMGAFTALFGPLLITFTQRFHVSLPTAGAALSVYFVGAFVGVLPGWVGLRRLPGRHVLTLALLTIAAGAFAMTLTNDWTLFLLDLFVIGLGFGTLDIGLNTMLARTALEGRARRLSVGNAGYGIGAVISPLLIIAVHPDNFPALMAAFGVMAIVLATLNRGLHAPAARTESLPGEIVRVDGRRAILVTFTIAYALYVGAETAASGWLATQIHHAGYSLSIAIVVTAGFWTGLALGRLLGGPLHRWASERFLVLGGLVLAVVLVLVSSVASLAPYAYPLVGFVIASIFPMGLMWYTTLCPNDSDGVSLMIFVMMAGGFLVPALVSVSVSHLGVRSIPFVLAAVLLGDLGCFLSALRFRPVVVTPPPAPS